MNARFLLAACLTLALAAPAFAQDAASPAASGASDAPAAPASDAAAKPAKKHHAKKHHAHAAGDPMHIDHSMDHAPVANPTESKVAVPASGQ